MHSVRALIVAMALALHANYPAATLQDVYKTCYQDFWGAEHAAPDSASAVSYLQQELLMMADDTAVIDMEPCGWRHHYQRVPLQWVKTGKMTEQQLSDAFLRSASSAHYDRMTSAQWRREWRKIERLSVEAVPAWRNDTLQSQLRMAAKNTYPVHHSASYRAAYRPHYRIVSTSVLDTIVPKESR